MAGGRPTKYRDSLSKAICIRLMMGESLNSICKNDMYPNKSTIFRWLASNDKFCDKYQRAREIQQEHHLDELLEIADDGNNDWMERLGKDGQSMGWQLNGEHVQRSKLRIDSRKWIMERMAARKYGDKKQIDHLSTDGSMTPKEPVTLNDFYASDTKPES